MLLQDKEDVEHMAVMGRGGKSRKGRQCKSMAMIEVQKTVALDMDERQVKDSGDIMEKTKLAVSTESKSMIPVKEGEVSEGHDFAHFVSTVRIQISIGDDDNDDDAMEVAMVMMVVVMVRKEELGASGCDVWRMTMAMVMFMMMVMIRKRSMALLTVIQ